MAHAVPFCKAVIILSYFFINIRKSAIVDIFGQMAELGYELKKWGNELLVVVIFLLKEMNRDR